MFSDRLNTAMRIVGASASDIARYMNCDRSNVCRFTRGQRMPMKDGGAAQRLTGAIYAAAEKSGSIESLCGLIGSTGTAEDIRFMLMQWLYQDENTQEEPPQLPAQPMPYRSFGRRLDMVMKLSNTSNIRLGKLLSIDPSYISRFRNGFRSPKSNNRLMDGMAQALLTRIYEQDQVRELAGLMNLGENIPAGEKKLYPLFYRWLYGVERDESPAIETLVERISVFEYPEDITASTEVGAAQTVYDDKGVFFGIEGMQKAVLRFLNLVCESRASEMYLYSDQSIDWMTGSPEYARAWSSMMTRCLRNGTHLNIIHNIERGLNEMTNAIQSWLPLYPTGNINSYYCKRKADERFSTTLFVCPGLACVSGHNVKGREDESGMYRFESEPRILNACLRAFRSLQSESGELVRAFPTTMLEKTSMTTDAGITVIASRLSLATIPEDLLISMLGRSGADDRLKNDIREMWQRQSDFYDRTLKKEFIHECIPIGYEKFPYADLPGITLRYTGEEYLVHLKRLEELSKTCESYRLYPLPQPVFDKIRIRIARDEIVISRLDSPHITYVFEHPYLCGSFIAYGKKIKEIHYTDKQTAEKIIREIIETT